MPSLRQLDSSSSHGTSLKSRKAYWTNMRSRSSSCSSAIHVVCSPCINNRYEDNVVQDNFKFGDDKQIVCCLSFLFQLPCLPDASSIVDCGITERCSCP